ncbi:hypothetical protein [Xanthomonas sacchari]|uniref:hypothetical protein n=1 Tax=Xanthomonas sacchari TaxID=56458 RepID=UPI0020C36324|nr:hypothetical protein [Xanthomonas sacchari]
MKCKALWLAVLATSPAFATELNGSTGYYGPITSVASGFFQSVGVALPSGTTCNGKTVLILKRDNAFFKEIQATLLTALANNRNVHVGPVIGDNVDSNGFCVVSEVSLERFPSWTTQ